MLADVFGLDAIWAVVIIAILLFGGAAIPKLARSLGSAKTQFEKGIDEGKKARSTAPRIGVRRRRRVPHAARPRRRRRAPERLTLRPAPVAGAIPRGAHAI